MAVYVRPDPTQPGWADVGEAVRPSNPDIAIGWPDTQIPPSRQEFNWLDKQQDAGIKYLCRVGIAQYADGEQYQGFGLCIGANGSVYWNLRACQGVNPVFDNQGFWELTPIRIADGDARYITQAAAASLYLTRAQGDALYQLKVDMANFVTFAIGDARYALKTELGQYVTFPAGDQRYAFRSDLSLYETVAGAAGTYLRIIDAANTYLTQSAAAQTYLTIAQANAQFAAAATNATNYTNSAVANAIAAQQTWTNSRIAALLPGIVFSRNDYSGTGWNATWMTLTCSPNNGLAFAACWGRGDCVEGSTITVPPNFAAANIFFSLWIRQYTGTGLAGDALLNFTCAMTNNYVTYCRAGKSNNNNLQFATNVQGAWSAFGYRPM